jgi:hypothetical protein
MEAHLPIWRRHGLDWGDNMSDRNERAGVYIFGKTLNPAARYRD